MGEFASPRLVSVGQLLDLYPAIKPRTLRYWIQNAARVPNCPGLPDSGTTVPETGTDAPDYLTDRDPGDEQP